MAHKSRSRWSVVALAAGVLTLGAWAAPARAQSASASPRVTLERASALVAEGHVVHARVLLERLLGEPDQLSDNQRTDAAALLTLAIRKIERMGRADPNGLSIQKANVAILMGDLRTAERHARAVLQSSDADADQLEDAVAALRRVEQRRDQLARLVPDWYDQAVRDFEAGRFAEAASGFEAVRTAAIELDPDMLAAINEYRAALDQRGYAPGDAGPHTLAVMQPGVVKEREDDEQPAEEGQEGDDADDDEIIDVTEEVEEIQPEEEPAAEEDLAEDTTEAAQDVEEAQPGDEPGEVEDVQPVQQVEPTPVEVVDVEEQQPAAPDTQPEEDIQPEAPPEEAEPVAPPPADEEDVIRVAMRAAALNLLSEATRAEEERRLREAADKYRQVRDEYAAYLTADELQRAERGYNRAILDLRGQPGTTGDLLSDYDRSRKLAREQISAEFNNYMGEARRALESGNIAGARDAAGQARLKANSGRDIFAESTFQDFQRQVDELMVEIDEAEEARRRAEAAREEEERKRQAAITQRRQREERQAKINELIDRARSLQAELRYEEALQTVTELLHVDPNNPTALLLEDLYQAIILYRDYNQANIDKTRSMGEMGLDSLKATITTPDIINYPEDWPAKTLQRGGGLSFGETPRNRRILSLLESRRIAGPTPLDQTPLEDALAYVDRLGDGRFNMDIDWDSLEVIGITRDTPVSLSLRDVTVRRLLDQILKKVSPDAYATAEWAVVDGILTIASHEKIRQNTVTEVYDVSDLLMDTPSYDDVPDMELTAILNSDEEFLRKRYVEEVKDEFRSRETRLTMEDKRDRVIRLIESHVDPTGWRSHGGDTSSIFPNDRSLVITTTARNHQEISGLLGMLRETRAMQINVETRFLLVNQDWFEQIGFDLDVVFNANNNQVTAAQGVDPTIQARDFFNFDASNPTFGQTGPGLNRNVTGQAPIAGIPGTPNPQTIGVINPSPTSPVGALQNSIGIASGLVDSQFASDILGTAPALGVAFQFLDDVQVDFLMVATQADRRSISLTAPRLTFTNGQTANVFVATQVSFVSDLQPIVGESAVGFDPTVDVVSEGVTLLVEGTISADRRYVTMNVDAGVSRIDGFGQEEVTAVAGGQLVSSVTTGSFIQLPIVTVTRVQTTVTVPDQGTILMGGQRVITEFDVESGVPVLSKIPIINRFFTNRIESKEEQTLLILMKPTVLIQSEQEETNFPGLLDSVRGGLGG